MQKGREVLGDVKKNKGSHPGSRLMALVNNKVRIPAVQYQLLKAFLPAQL